MLVIGSASLDVLHLGEQTVHSAGGAGLYTALAARCAGARAGLLAPRPDPMPELLRPAAGRIEWFGPIVAPGEISRLEIAHHGGGRATLIDAAWGAVTSLAPDMLPPDLPAASIMHIAALPTADQQMAFLQACRERSVRRVSVGTYARLIAAERDRVRALFDAADVFFMNENEANLLFGAGAAARTQPDRLLFVTQGARGALVIEGERVTRVPGQPAIELDPTGAGDTFCGCVLAGLVRGEDALTAARAGVALAAEMIGAIGPARLLAC
ncbi:MAG TPA: PfkB family carbohydrate kinase [Anaerolineae bacterium]